MTVLEKVTSQAPHLETSKVRFKKVLVATDFSRFAEKAVAAATTLAKQFDAELYIANVVLPVIYPDRAGLVGPNILEAEESAAWTAMSRIREDAAIKKLRHHEIVRFGPVVSTILDMVNEFAIDLVVVGTHGAKGFEKLLLGSVAESLLRECNCPVLTVGPKAKIISQDFDSILFPTALTVESLRANQYAVSLAEAMDAKITVLHVVEERPPQNHALGVEMRRALKDQMRELVPVDAFTWCTPHFKVEYGNAATQILEVAHEVKADLIVLGAHDSKTLADHAPWATVSKIIAHAHCPVLTVRPHFDRQALPKDNFTE